jgi:hypothetical protein
MPAMSFAPAFAAPRTSPIWRGEGVSADARVATPRGPVPVSALRVGDDVLAADGGTLRVVALRCEPLAGIAFRRLGMVAPVRLASGALGLGRPRQELVLGPAQPVRLGGVALPADLLLDGVTATRVEEDVRLVAPVFDRAGAWLAGGLALGGPAETRPDAVAEALLHLSRPAGRLEGHVDFADRAGVLGWARDAARPQGVVVLEVVADGQVIARAPADRPRPDLVREGLGAAQARHGFALRFPRPLASGRAWLLEVRRAGSGMTLPGSPVLVDGAGGEALRFDTALAALPAQAAEMLAQVTDRAVAARFRQ